MKFMVMTDEHVANAISEQLVRKGIEAIRLIDALPESTPDPDVLEYCHQHGYALITLDKGMRDHAASRFSEEKEHAGIFLGNKDFQGAKGIGTIVKFIIFFNDAVNGGAASVEDDVYNEIIDITEM